LGDTAAIPACAWVRGCWRDVILRQGAVKAAVHLAACFAACGDGLSVLIGFRAETRPGPSLDAKSACAMDVPFPAGAPRYIGSPDGNDIRDRRLERRPSSRTLPQRLGDPAPPLCRQPLPLYSGRVCGTVMACQKPGRFGPRSPLLSPISRPTRPPSAWLAQFRGEAAVIELMSSSIAVSGLFCRVLPAALQNGLQAHGTLRCPCRRFDALR